MFRGIKVQSFQSVFIASATALIDDFQLNRDCFRLN